MESPGESADLVYCLDGDSAQAMCLSLRLVDRVGIVEGTQADQKRRHQLTRFIVQFPRNPAPLLLLRLKHTFEQQPMRRLSLFQSGNLQTSGLSLLALGDVATDDGHSNDFAIAGTDW
jgi:hypothetical protein